MRKVRIEIVFDENKPNEVRYESFPECFSDYDIDDFCYDIIEREFNNQVWFCWEEYTD